MNSPLALCQYHTADNPADVHSRLIRPCKTLSKGVHTQHLISHHANDWLSKPLCGHVGCCLTGPFFCHEGHLKINKSSSQKEIKLYLSGHKGLSLASLGYLFASKASLYLPHWDFSFCHTGPHGLKKTLQNMKIGARPPGIEPRISGSLSLL